MEFELDRRLPESRVFTYVDLLPIFRTELARRGTDLEWDDLVSTVDALCDRFAAAGGVIDLPPVVLEREIETWLVENLSAVGRVLSAPGLRLHSDPDGRTGRQWTFASGTDRADLLCRIGPGSDRLDEGTWVVVELKRGRAERPDLDQVNRCARPVLDELDDDDHGVVALLVADGYSRDAALAAADEAGPVMLLSLAELRYHEHTVRLP